MPRERHRYQQRRCEVCGEAYWPTYEAQRTCSRSHGNWLKARAVHSCPVPWATCGYRRCGRWFIARHRRSFCSDKCARGENNARSYLARAGTSTITRDCADCGAVFSYPNRQGKPSLRCPSCQHRKLQADRNAAKQRRRKWKLAVLRRALWDNQGGVCSWCGESMTSLTPTAVHVDHIWPLAAGGVDEVQNLQLLHGPCNEEKHDSIPPAGWATWLKEPQTAEWWRRQLRQAKSDRTALPGAA